MIAKLVSCFARHVVTASLVLMLGASFFGMGNGAARVDAATHAECVLHAESFQPPRVGSEPFELHDLLALGTNEVWVTGTYGADYVTVQDFVQHWDGTKWNELLLPPTEQAQSNSKETAARDAEVKNGGECNAVSGQFFGVDSEVREDV